jgi:hypothetical protein
MDWINQLVDDLANRLYAAGRIRNTYSDEGFYTRLTMLEREFPGAAVLVHIGGVLGQPVAELWGSKDLLDVIQQILGPDIAGHPVWNALQDAKQSAANRPLASRHSLLGRGQRDDAAADSLDPADRRHRR